jgi:hypothetical protein
MVSTVLRNIQSAIFVIRNLSNRSFIEIQSTIKLFVDDTSLYLIIDNPQTTTDILNRDLDKIQRTGWFHSIHRKLKPWLFHEQENPLYQLTLISFVNPDAKPYQMPY